jgi:hypothetical protein
MIGNRKELAHARRKASEALEALSQIEALPRRRGSRIRWPNGTIWTRVGDDDWRPENIPEIPYPSAHVASLRWEIVSPNAEKEQRSKIILDSPDEDCKDANINRWYCARGTDGAAAGECPLEVCVKRGANDSVNGEKS